MDQPSSGRDSGGPRLDVYQSGADVKVNIGGQVHGNVTVQGQVVNTSASGATQNLGSAQPRQPEGTPPSKESLTPTAPKGGVKVTEKKLDQLADNFPSDDMSYKTFCRLIGINANKADNIFDRHHKNRIQAVRDCLQMYKNRTGAYQDDLLRILDEAELGDMKEFIQ